MNNHGFNRYISVVSLASSISQHGKYNGIRSGWGELCGRVIVLEHIVRIVIAISAYEKKSHNTTTPGTEKFTSSTSSFLLNRSLTYSIEYALTYLLVLELGACGRGNLTRNQQRRVFGLGLEHDTSGFDSFVRKTFKLELLMLIVTVVFMSCH